MITLFVLEGCGLFFFFFAFISAFFLLLLALMPTYIFEDFSRCPFKAAFEVIKSDVSV